MRSGSCPRQQRPPSQPSRSMWRAISTSLPIVAALILLPAVAFASPPDSSWIAGIYDGADGDDIVTLVYDTAAANTAVLAHIAPLSGLSDISLESIVRGFPGGRFTRGPRAPPLLYSPVSAHVFNSLPEYTPTAAGARKLSSPARRSRSSLSRRGAIALSSPAAKFCPG
jgi:hypothetical protein